MQQVKNVPIEKLSLKRLKEMLVEQKELARIIAADLDFKDRLILQIRKEIRGRRK